MEDMEFKSGFVALVGRPNVGKSTLANACVGEKVAITSPTPQTTRSRVRAIVDGEDFQMVLVDTPGLHKPHDVLSEELNNCALQAIDDVDVVCMLIDATKTVGKGDAWVAAQVNAAHCPRILVITKADLAGQDKIADQIKVASDLCKFDDVIVLSAVEDFNVDAFINCCVDYLPEGPRWFPEGSSSDQPLEVLVSEFIREKVLRQTFDEVPHAVGVQVEEIQQTKGGMYRMYAIIYCERESQKGILVGKGGERIKQIGIDARNDLMHILGAPVHLDLRVKVKKDWRRDVNQIRRFGYGGEGI